MKPVRLRPRARQDRRDEVRCYRAEAGSRVALKLAGSLQPALAALESHPAIGSPAMGRALGIDGLRTWPVEGFPLSFWYSERRDHVDVIRLVGQRQDALRIDTDVDWRAVTASSGSRFIASE